jgi:hypothetical protein
MEIVKKRLGLIITTPKIDKVNHSISFGMTSGNQSLNEEVRKASNDYLKMNPSRGVCRVSSS